MKKKANSENWSVGWQWFVSVIIFVAIVMFLASQSFGVTYFSFTYPSGDGTSGRFIVRAETSGDSIAGGTLSETDRGALTYWAGSTTVAIGSYVVEGFIFEGSDTSVGAYRVDVSAKAAYDEVANVNGWNPITINESLVVAMAPLANRPAIGDTIQREAATATELAAAIDTLNAILDTLQQWDDEIAGLNDQLDSLYAILDTLQEWDDDILEINNLVDSLYATLDSLQAWSTNIALIGDSIVAALGDAAMGDKMWVDAVTRNLTALGFDLDSADFANKAFPVWLFTTGFFDSAQGSVSGLTAMDFWNVAFGAAFDAGSMGDSLNNSSYVQGGATGVWTIAQRDSVLDRTLKSLDSIIAILDTIQAGFASRAIIGDTIGREAATGVELAIAIDTLNAIIDSLQAWDDDIAEINNLVDSLYAVLDTVQEWDDDIAKIVNLVDSLNACLDTLQAWSIDIALLGDSLAGALSDAAIGDKAWVDATDRTLSAFSFLVSLAAGQPTIIAESTYTKFTAGANEDEFKSTGDTNTQSYPTNFDDLAITATTGRVTVGTNVDKDGYSVSGTITTLDGLNDFDPANDKVTLTDSSAGDISLVANNPDSYKATGFMTSIEYDSLMMWLGYEIGAVSHSDYAAIQDTVWIRNGNDTLGKIIYYHPGGEAGDAPDSTKTEAP